jgi:hypothetical protein
MPTSCVEEAGLICKVDEELSDLRWLPKCLKAALDAGRAVSSCPTGHEKGL